MVQGGMVDVQGLKGLAGNTIDIRYGEKDLAGDVRS